MKTSGKAVLLCYITKWNIKLTYRFAIKNLRFDKITNDSVNSVLLPSLSVNIPNLYNTLLCLDSNDLVCSSFQMTKPQSFPVLLQLPPRQLESAFEVSKHTDVSVNI